MHFPFKPATMGYPSSIHQEYPACPAWMSMQGLGSAASPSASAMGDPEVSFKLSFKLSLYIYIVHVIIIYIIIIDHILIKSLIKSWKSITDHGHIPGNSSYRLNLIYTIDQCYCWETTAEKGRFYSRKRPNVTNAYKCQQDPTILTCHMELVTEQFHLGKNNSNCFSCRPKLHPRSGKATSLSDASIDRMETVLMVALHFWFHVGLHCDSWTFFTLRAPDSRFQDATNTISMNPTNHFAASHVWSQPGSRLPWKSRLRLKLHHH